MAKSNRLKNNSKDVVTPDPYSNIYQYAEDYQYALDQMGEGVGTKYPWHETLAVVVKSSDLKDIIEESEYMVAVLGVEGGKLTVSFLGADVTFSGSTIVSARVNDRYVSGSEPGQEVWPKITLDKFYDLLPEPRRKRK